MSRRILALRVTDVCDGRAAAKLRSPSFGLEFEQFWLGIGAFLELRTEPPFHASFPHPFFRAPKQLVG